MKLPPLAQNDPKRRPALPTPFKPTLCARHVVAALGFLDPPPAEGVGAAFGEGARELGVGLDLGVAFLGEGELGGQGEGC